MGAQSLIPHKGVPNIPPLFVIVDTVVSLIKPATCFSRIRSLENHLYICGGTPSSRALLAAKDEN